MTTAQHPERKKTPGVRFPGFHSVWKEEELGKLFTERTERNGNRNFDLLSVTLSNGVTKQESSKKRDSSSADKSNYKVVHKNDIAYNTMRMWQGASGVSKYSGIVSPAYTVVSLKKGSIDFYKYLFKQPRSIFDFYRFSQGLTSDTWNLKFKHFSEVVVCIPENIEEQQKIADILESTDLWIRNLRSQKESLETYKKGVLQKIFSQDISFNDNEENRFPKWKQKTLKEVLTERKERNLENKYQEVFSVAKGRGVVNQIEHLGRSYSATDLSNYKVVHPGDIVYTKSPTADFPFGIIKQNRLDRSGLVSTLYAVYQPVNEYLGYILHSYFLSPIKTFNYLNPLVHKGAKNTMNIGNSAFLNGSRIYLPVSEIEQRKIAEFLFEVDKLIAEKYQEIIYAEQWKKGLMQQLFI